MSSSSGSVAASTSAPLSAQTSESSANTAQSSVRKSNSLWNQYMTSTGWFAPLIPPESPSELAEKQRRRDEKIAQEKLRSVHTWRPSSQDAVTAAQPKRPTFRQRMSSAVELKWWPTNNARPTEADVDETEEDLQRPTSRNSASHIAQRAPANNDYDNPIEHEDGQNLQMR
ncbi:hypothetical protein EMMF5_005697 [Cystobasidiomycetes sp. EMM_F5]